jgi:hypothetical protein
MPATGSAERLAEAHRQLVADGSIQTELKPFQMPEVPAWVRWLGELLDGYGPVIKVIFWSVVACLVLLLLYALARWLEGRGLSWRRAAAEQEEEWRPQESTARALLDEADALAASGRYSEAAHLLLFRSIEEIDSRRPDLVRPALTSRDIAGAPALPAGPKRAFADIVLQVERSLFGGRALGELDWRGCRAAYEEFAFAPEWRG